MRASCRLSLGFPLVTQSLSCFLLTLLAWAGIGEPSTRGAQYNCSALTPATIAGKTLWITISSGTAPYANSGTYQLRLATDGTFEIPAGGSQPARTGTWSASVPSETFVVRLKGFLGDTTEDVLALFNGCLNGPSCSTCGFGLTREGVPGVQLGDYTVTDGEAPNAPSAPRIDLVTGGGIYPVGGNIVLMAQALGTSTSYRYKWFKDDVELAGKTTSFLFINPAQPSDAGTYRIDVSNAGGKVSLATRIVITAAGRSPMYLDRPWARVFGPETAIPRQPALNGELPAMRLAVRGGAVYGLDGSRGNWLARSRNGSLTTLVAADDALADGTTIRSISNFAVDTNGVVVIYAQASDAFGLFEASDAGIRRITRVGSPTPQGNNVTFAGFGALALRGGRLLFAGADSQNKTALYTWDGQAIATVLPPDSDLPGTLGKLFQILTLSFDGTTIALTANDTVLFNGNNRRGVFRGTVNGPWQELANVQSTIPSYSSFQLRQIHGSDIAAGSIYFSVQSGLGAQLYAGDASGRFHLVGPSHSADLVTAQFAAANRQTVLLRNADQFTRISEGYSERILGLGDVLDGRTISDVRDVAADGDDAAVLVRFSDGSSAIYAATGGAAIPVTPVEIGKPTLVDHALTFSLNTQPGTTYRVEVRSDLAAGSWTVLRSIVGDGTIQKVGVGTDGAVGFVRIAATQP